MKEQVHQPEAHLTEHMDMECARRTAAHNTILLTHVTTKAITTAFKLLDSKCTAQPVSLRAPPSQISTHSYQATTKPAVHDRYIANRMKAL